MIRELVNKLGDEDFVVRQQSEALLFQIGIAAFADLEEAKVGPDPEIAARAEFLLSRLETVYRGPRDYAAEHYSKAEIPFQKASYLRLFAHPKEYPGGLGLAFLIHLARFEKDRPLQIEAIKALIASPPESLDNGRVWYRHIAETFAEPGPTEPLRLLSDYAKLRCEFDELSETAWNGALRNARESATMLEIPTLPITDALRGRTLDLLQRMKAFQEDPEFSVFKKGHWIDILFFYAMAEMLDVIGETEARDRIVAEAVAVQSAPYPADHSLLIAIVNEERKNFDHYTVGLALKWRYRLAWSLNHLRITIDEGDALLRVLAGAELAECYRLMNDYEAATKAWEERLESATRPEYTKMNGDRDAIAVGCKARIAVLQGYLAAAKGDWKAVEKCLAEGKRAEYENGSLLILQRFYERNAPEVTQPIRDETTLRITQALKNQLTAMNNLSCPTDTACFNAAMLLMEEPEVSVSAVEMARLALRLKPQTPEYLDGLARIYHAEKQYKKSIETLAEAIRLAPEATLYQDRLRKMLK